MPDNLQLILPLVNFPQSMNYITLSREVRWLCRGRKKTNLSKEYFDTECLASQYRVVEKMARQCEDERKGSEQDKMPGQAFCCGCLLANLCEILMNVIFFTYVKKLKKLYKNEINKMLIFRCAF